MLRNTLNDLFYRLRALFRRKAVEQELCEELQFHFDHQVEKNLAQGMSREEATRQARLAFGGSDQVKEECREARGTGWPDELWRNLRYAGRSMRKSPGFATVAVLSLALGIGANVAVFSLLNRLVLTPLPVQDAERLQHVVLSAGYGSHYQLSYVKYEILRDNFDVFETLFGWSARSFPLTLKEQSLTVETQAVTGNYFEALGVRPTLGRLLRPDDDRSGFSDTAVISYRLWRDLFGGEKSVLGRNMTLGAETYRIVGVAPREFLGLQSGFPPDVYLPIHAAERFAPHLLLNEGVMGFKIMGRLEPTISLAAAQTALREGWPRFSKPRQAFLGDNGVPEYLRLEDGSRGYSPVRRDLSGAVMALMGLAAAVFLIACANLATLLFVRGIERAGEMSMRLALGARRAQLVRQWMTECALLAMLGGGVGLFLAQWITDVLLLFVEESDRGWLRFEADASVVALSIGLTLAAGLLFGLLPALRASRADIQSLIKKRSASMMGRRGWLTQAVLTGQLAAALVLVVVAVFFARTLWNLNRASGGFDRTRVAYAYAQFWKARFPEDRIPAVMGEVLERLRNSPRIASVGGGALPIAEGSGSWGWVTVPGYTFAPSEENVAYSIDVTPGYFESLGISLLAGRDFGESDRGSSWPPAVAIINEQFARHYFQSENPIGKHFKMYRSSDTAIVGVVKDAKDANLREPQRELIYYPMTRDSSFTIVARAKPGVDAAVCETEIRSALAALAKDVPIESGTMEEAVQISLGRDRLTAQLSAAFGLLGVLLACIGLYGSTAQTARGRTREIGLRIALGAGRSDIVRLILGQSLLVTLLGTAIGLAAAIGAGRLIESLLFEVSVSDPLTLGLSALVLAVVGLTAGLWPALRAARVDPCHSLRAE
ncbi:MAG TPA: ABC transporter permease [Bryobacterales bacterium]|nr:ABC transporter permease [Bryobacterales bacterium]